MTAAFALTFAAVAALFTPAPTATDTREARVTVQVDTTKPNHKAWDAWGGAPDIALCVSTELGTQCYPDGTSVRGILHPACRDTFTCHVTVTLPARADFDLVVVDVDASMNDTVGSGPCRVGRTCSLGSARVTVETP